MTSSPEPNDLEKMKGRETLGPRGRNEDLGAMVNAIKAVVAAPPGLMTSADLPLRAFAGRFKA